MTYLKKPQQNPNNIHLQNNLSFQRGNPIPHQISDKIQNIVIDPISFGGKNQVSYGEINSEINLGFLSTFSKLPIELSSVFSNGFICGAMKLHNETFQKCFYFYFYFICDYFQKTGHKKKTRQSHGVRGNLLSI